MNHDPNHPTALPKAPHPPRTLQQDTNKGHDEYYIKTQVLAVLQKYSGQGKGLEVSIDQEDLVKLNKLKSLFGKGFDANHIICIGYKYTKSRPHTPQKPQSNYYNEQHNKTIKIKPSEDSLTAIFKFSKESNSAAMLLKIGIDFLYDRLLPLSEF